MDGSEKSARIRFVGSGHLRLRAHPKRSSNPATDRAIATYVRDPDHLLAVAIERVAHASPLSDAEVHDFSRLIDEEKGALQMVLTAHTAAQVSRMRPLNDAMDKVYARLFDDDRVAQANTDSLLKMAQYLDNKKRDILSELREEIGETRPKHITNLILQQQEADQGGAIAGDIQNLPPSTRAKLRLLFDVLVLKAQEAHASRTPTVVTLPSE